MDLPTRQGWRRRVEFPGSAGSTALFAFIVLKLTGVITWSWWWVLSPLWLSGPVVLLMIAGMLALGHWEASRRWLGKLLGMDESLDAAGADSGSASGNGSL